MSNKFKTGDLLVRKNTDRHLIFIVGYEAAEYTGWMIPARYMYYHMQDPNYVTEMRKEYLEENYIKVKHET